MTRTTLLRFALAGMLAVAAHGASDGDRAAQWKVPEIFKALGLAEGQCIADIGCGDGFLSLRLAAVVAPHGRVFAVDISAHALEQLKRRAAEAQLQNIEIIKGTESDPRLGSATLDGAVVLRAYHEFTHHQEMLGKIFTALRPGARIVITDVAPASARAREGRAAQVSRHVLSLRMVERDLIDAGFRVVLSVPEFTRINQSEIVWLVAAERPAR
jgi:ubiquinone/menaquinone biosynthesis C-methylase UbiE